MSNDRWGAAFHGQNPGELPQRDPYASFAQHGAPPEHPHPHAEVPPGPAPWATYQAPPRKSKGKVIGWTVAGVTGAIVILCCGIGIFGADPEKAGQPASSPTVQEPTYASPTVQTTEPTPPTKKVAQAPRFGDGTYHVGEDIPAGTYRLEVAATKQDLCYWSKSRDAEGSDIISNDIGGVGRLQVTLKSGQWFESNRCGTWVRRG